MRGGSSIRLVWMAAALLLLGTQLPAQELRLPRDLTYRGGDGSPGPVVFSHESHVGYADKCTTCHIALFRILQPTRRLTHAAMEAGQVCGACHNGQAAFPPSDPAACTRCHGEERKPS